MDAKELITDVLINAGKPLKSSEIATLSGLSKEETDRAVKVLKSEGKIYSPQRCFWQTKQ